MDSISERSTTRVSTSYQLFGSADCNRPRWHRWVAAFLLSATIAHAVVSWQQRLKIAAGYGDFAAFYTAGLMLRRGLGPHLYDRREEWNVQQEFASRVEIRKGPLPFIRPPFEAVLFFPLSYFPYPQALAVWSFAKVGVLLISLWILRRPFGRIYPPWLEVILCLGLFPVYLDLIQGQDSIFLLLLVVLAFNNLLAFKDVRAGAYLGLGLFKFNLVLPMILLLSLTGRWRVLKGFAPAAAGLLMLSVAIAGPRILVAYPAYLLKMNRLEGVAFINPQSMPNLRGLLTAWVGRAAYPGPIHWILLPIAVLVIIYAACLWRAQIADSKTVVLGFCLTLLVSILISYYAKPYDMSLLILPLLLLGGDFLKQPEVDPISRALLVRGLLLLICTPLYWILVVRLDAPYLLTVFMGVVAVALVRALKRSTHPVPRVA